MVKTTEYTKLILITLGLLALFILISLLLKSAVQVLLLIFTGILFSIFIRGLSDFLFGRFSHLPENWGIAITLFLLVIAFFAFFILLAPQLAEQGRQLVERIPEAFQTLREKINHLEWLENLFGFLGLLLATPLTAAAMVLVKMLYIEDVLGETGGIDGTEK